MSTITEQKTTTQVYRVFIKAPQQKVWDAITSPDWTERYGYGGRVDYELKKGGSYKHYPSAEMVEGGKAGGFTVPDVIVDGEVLEAEPPHRLVTTWRMLMDPSMADEPHSTITYEIKELEGFCSLTLTHDLAGAPLTAALVRGAGEDEGTGGGGGHAWVLSDLKSLLETGATMAG